VSQMLRYLGLGIGVHSERGRGHSRPPGLFSPFTVSVSLQLWEFLSPVQRRHTYISP
jgi:hypothetical protein